MFMKLGVVGTAPAIVVVGLASGIGLFLVGMGVLNFFVAMVWIFLMAEATDKQTGSIEDTLLTRELFLNVGRVVSTAIAVVLMFYLDLGTVFALSALYLVGLLFIKK